jgi:hypothetical protein
MPRKEGAVKMTNKKPITPNIRPVLRLFFNTLLNTIISLEKANDKGLI